MSRPPLLLCGDSMEELEALPDNSVDAVVTDPPYAFQGGFMGRQWDRFDGREDAAFGYWLAGFSDGESCFRSQRHERGTHTCTFSIRLRRDDKAILERIKFFVGYGTIRDEDDGRANPTCSYVVGDRDGCDTLVTIFRKYPLRGKKRLDFEAWAEAVGEWLDRPRGNRWKGHADQTAAISHKAAIERARRYVDPPWSGHLFQDWCRQWSQEVIRVMKPGAHILAFSSSKNYHRLTCALEDAGFEIRDCVMWVYAGGMPKGMDISKAIDREAGAERPIIGEKKKDSFGDESVNKVYGTGPDHGGVMTITAPATPEAAKWNGWNTQLKPAHEPIVLARKPFPGTVAGNILAHGTGGLNIDGCRIHDGSETGNPKPEYKPNYGNQVFGHGKGGGAWENTNGRWPANLIHDGSPEVLALFPDAKGQLAPASNSPDTRKNQNTYGAMAKGSQAGPPRQDSDKSAARFFYCSKASKSDRGEGNPHPTVKPQALMRYLCRLITPPGGLILDPFMGSGSTGVAAVLEGFRFAGIDLDHDYVALSRRRIQQAITQAQEEASAQCS